MVTRRNFSIAGLGALTAAAIGWKSLPSGAVAGAKDKMFEITKTPAEWKKLLTPEQYYVLREHGTERAGTSPLDKVYSDGTYHCAGCDLPLYASNTKFDSRTGWPSFWKPIDNAIGQSVDRAWGMTRTEIHCRRCGGHLGHVFNDGPQPTGLRYCMNGDALVFKPEDKTSADG